MSISLIRGMFLIAQVGKHRTPIAMKEALRQPFPSVDALMLWMHSLGI
jgi:hypothetical protein